MSTTHPEAPFRVQTIFDLSLTPQIKGGSNTETAVAANPSVLTFEGLTPGSTVTALARINSTGTWQSIGTVNTTVASSMFLVPAEYNQVKVTGMVAGSKAYAQLRH